jgi:WD40 repeat protein
MRTIFVLVLCLLALTGCQPAAELAPTPTLFDLNAAATENAATAAALASPTPRGLPPTWTPSPEPTIIPTDVAQAPTITPAGFNAVGTLYYIFNGDAIVKLIADGSFEELIPIPHIGMGLSDLTMSPDGLSIAYVAPGSGSAREIYITDREGNTTRQVSKLGFARVEALAWRPDSSSIAFLASQAPDSPLDIYIISADGTGQRPLTQRASRDLHDLAWNRAGDKLFFNDGPIYALDLATGAVSQPLTSPTGFGSDFGLVHSPTTDELYYFKPFRDFDTSETFNILSYIPTASITETPTELSGMKLPADYLSFSQDGKFLLVATNDAIWVQNQDFNTAVQILSAGSLAPIPVFSANGEQLAHINNDAAGVPQIFTLSRQGEGVRQITFHQEGTISDMVWAAS